MKLPAKMLACVSECMCVNGGEGVGGGGFRLFASTIHPAYAQCFGIASIVLGTEIHCLNDLTKQPYYVNRSIVVVSKWRNNAQLHDRLTETRHHTRYPL